MIYADLALILGGNYGGFRSLHLDLIRTYVLYMGPCHGKIVLRNRQEVHMSAETLSLVSGVVVSLTFSYIPGTRSWFEKFDPEIKRSIMLVLLTIIAGIVFGLSCAGWASEWSISLSCNRSGLLGLIEQLILAIIANQGTYAISPRNNRNSSPTITSTSNS
jgi:hypothetical protein